MKLLFCKSCLNVRSLRVGHIMGYCPCGQSYGRYLSDGLHAEVGGNCIVIGFSNESLADAIREQPEDGWGKIFDAFVIPKECPTVRVLDKKNSENTNA